MQKDEPRLILTASLAYLFYSDNHICASFTLYNYIAELNPSAQSIIKIMSSAPCILLPISTIREANSVDGNEEAA
jgi:hypothetical protein